MIFEPRWYQDETVEALWADIHVPGRVPVAALPTGSGKTAVMAFLIEKYLKTYPDNRIVILSHTQEILEQDYNALVGMMPNEDIGLFSSGLGKKEVCQVTVAGIQSIVNAKESFAWTNLYIIDECHTVSHKNEGRYRKLLDGTQANILGLSATVFRTGHGYIYEGVGTIFNHLSVDMTTGAKFNRLVEDGYLCRLVSVAPELQLDSKSVKKTGGEYNIKALAKEHDKDSITEAAILEAKKYGKNYKKWLVFAIDIDHANHICRHLNRSGIRSRVLHSRITADRKDVISSFKTGQVQALVSVGMITTGFDAPNVDMILMLRPTMSAVLHVQMIGRGLRIFPTKDHCLVLDFSGNTENLGPINNPIIPKKPGDKTGPGEAPTKKCPNCRTITYAKAKFCESCGHEFIFEVKLTLTSSIADVVQTEDPEKLDKVRWLNVTRVQYNLHKKAGRPDSIQVTYHCGITRVKQWWGIDHGGRTGDIARHQVLYRGYKGEMNTYAVYRAKDTLGTPKQILVDFNGQYPNIKNAKF